MSFSGSVKEELLRYEDSARHCCIAELAAMIAFHGEIVPAPQGKLILTISSENESILRKVFTLLEKTFTMETGCHDCFSWRNCACASGKINSYHIFGK